MTDQMHSEQEPLQLFRQPAMMQGILRSGLPGTISTSPALPVQKGLAVPHGRIGCGVVQLQVEESFICSIQDAEAVRMRPECQSSGTLHR